MSKQNTKRSSSAEPASARTTPLDLDLLVEDPKADLPTISAVMKPAQRSRDNILYLCVRIHNGIRYKNTIYRTIHGIRIQYTLRDGFFNG
jgi:hypothetical protein